MASSLPGRGVLAVALAIGLASPAGAQQRPLTLDTLYDPVNRVAFSGTPLPPLVWIDDARYAVQRQTSTGLDWLSVHAATGDSRTLLQTSRLEQALVSAGLSASAARQAAGSRGITFNESFSAALIVAAGDLFVYAIDAGTAVRLTRTDALEEVATFSPDGTSVAFVRQGNLFVAQVATARETKLTTDGNEQILNGRLDWVYEEEIFGRGLPKAYWWSPDSKRLAYMRIDDRHVPSFTVVDHVPYEQVVERWYYPKAGDPNPTATLGVVPAGGGETRWMDLARYPEADRIISAVTWSPDGREVVFQAQNRLQTWLDLNAARADSGAVRTVLRETSKAWVTDVTNPVWLKDGSFLWLSERTGFRHIYHYSKDGALLRSVTSGPWEVRTLHGASGAADGWVYFSGTERSPIGGDVYRTRRTSTGPAERLSKTPGTHTAEFSAGFSYFANTWSDVNTPPQLRVLRNDGSELGVVEANPVAALQEYVLPKPEFLQVKTRDGFVMEAMLIKPPDFDPSRRYPVFTFVYGGPHSQRVRNAWSSENLFLQLLAQQGIVVWECDNRTASGKGLDSTYPVYRNFGELELRDIEDGLAWLKGQPFVDGSRIGIHGWSYGGFLTAYALTHSTSFVMGIAGGTVSDWRNYDSMYTERYMGPPAENVEGYKKSSPRWAAPNLHGALLLIHGLTDDNVHVDNTIQLAHELQKAQKPFEMMLYPQSRHGITDQALVKHMRTLMFDFVRRHLRPDSPAAPPRTTGPR
jgi:dipeptidyl-peptidase-4